MNRKYFQVFSFKEQVSYLFIYVKNKEGVIINCFQSDFIHIFARSKQIHRLKNAFAYFFKYRNARLLRDKLLINKFKFTGPTNNIYKLLNNESITSSTLHLLLFMFMYTGTSPFTNKSTNDFLSLIYKSLMFISNAILLTFSLLGQGRVTTRTNRSLLVIKLLLFNKSLIFFVLLCNLMTSSDLFVLVVTLP